MRLNSDTPLAVELQDSETREHTVEAQIKIGIPFQIRAMREKRGMTQEALAEKLDTTQNTISRLENPRTGKPTITTLLRLARAFDVGLLVRFVPFSFYGDVINATDPTHIEIPSYEEELAMQEQQLEEEEFVSDEAWEKTANGFSLYVNPRRQGIIPPATSGDLIVGPKPSGSETAEMVLNAGVANA